MPADRMHADEVETDATLVRRLLAAQLPAWAELPIVRVASAGTDNAIYRLGDEFAARLPRRPEAAGHAAKEQRWLPVLAPRLPLAVPVPLAAGEPGEGYPWRWSVCPWLAGEAASAAELADPDAAAEALADFLAALQAADASGGPAAGAQNFFRGVPLADRDEAIRAALRALEGEIDTRAATAAWETALAAPPWERAPVWVHGDLAPGNLLVVGGRLSAVIDFGGLGVGDPACDLAIAWGLLPPGSRGVLRARLRVDDAGWARGRGWALYQGLIALPYYLHSNPPLVAHARHLIGQVLADSDD